MRKKQNHQPYKNMHFYNEMIKGIWCSNDEAKRERDKQRKKQRERNRERERGEGQGTYRMIVCEKLTLYILVHMYEH